MPVPLPNPNSDDPAELLIQRRREIETYEHKPAVDPRELAEREEAAKAYAGENEDHFVSYVLDCYNTSIRAHQDIRRIQGHCWNAYEENEPVNFLDKEEWQAKTIVPKPFQTVQFGAAAVKKAFTPQFLSIKNARNKASEAFWQKVMDFYLNEQHADFRTVFADACLMGLAIGTSSEMIPMFSSAAGLQIPLVEPWKIVRDPDALPRDPHSGMYWIHEEWLDYYVLKEAEKKQKYTQNLNMFIFQQKR